MANLDDLKSKIPFKKKTYRPFLALNLDMDLEEQNSSSTPVLENKTVLDSTPALETKIETNKTAFEKKTYRSFLPLDLDI